MNPLNGPIGGGNPLDFIGAGSVGAALGLDPVSNALRGARGGGEHRVETAAPGACPLHEAAVTERCSEEMAPEGYAPAPPGGEAAQGPFGGLLGFLAKLADPLGLFPGMNLADPLGLFGGGGMLGGGGEEGKAGGQLADQGQMFNLVGTLASDTGAMSALTSLV